MSRGKKGGGTATGLDVTVERAEILRGLRLAQSIADRKSTMPMLACALVRVLGQGRLLVAATDLSISVMAEVACEVVGEGGQAVSAKPLHDFVANLPDGQVAIRQVENGSCEISAARIRSKLVAMPGRDFPTMPRHDEVEFRTVDAATLRAALDRVAFSMCADETRFHLNGVLIESQGGMIRVVSTDGHRLTKIERNLPGMPALAGGIIVPRKAVVEIGRMLDTADEAGIAHHGPHLFVRAGGAVLATKLIESQYPPYEQVIPRSNTIAVEVDRELLLAALKRSKLMSTDNRGTRFDVEPGRLVISGDNPDKGEVREEIEIEYAGASGRVGFNARYIMDLLSNIPTPRIRLELGGELDPGVVRPVDDDTDYLGVVMPMRV